MPSTSEPFLRTKDPGVRCRIGRFTVSLHSDSARIAKDFAALYPDSPLESANACTPIRIQVRRVGRSRLGRVLYRVFADGEEIGGWRPRNGVFPLIEWGINLRIIAGRPEYLQLHAASLALRGEGFIFAGDSGCGKSTLAATLLSRKWHYLCDEFALVEPDTLTLQPFPKALCLKSGSFPVIERLGLRIARDRDYIKGPKGRVAYLSPNDLGDNAVDPTPRCRFIVFPAYRSGATPRLETLSRTLAVLELFRCAFNRDVFGDAILPLLTRLVSESACYRLEIGEPVATARLLESLVPIGKPAGGSGERRASATGPLADPRQSDRLQGRRQLLRLGAKLAYVAPAVAALSAHEALAATSNPSGICSTAKNTGELCETDTDCCSAQCNLGICQ